MAAGTRQSAHQRFMARQRKAASRRAHRRVLMLATVLPFALSSCVTSTPVARVKSSPNAPVQVASFDLTAPDAPGADGFAPMPPPTGPSFLAGQSARDQVRATLCLASAIYYEAATEPDEGQRAVAQVVLNRVRHPAWPNTVCGVVYQGSDQEGCQFSFACDGAMARKPSIEYWSRARRVAEAALAGAVYEPVGSATFYHTPAVAPAWRLRLIHVATVGGHIFYRQPQDAAEAVGLPMRYAGREPNPGPLPRVIPPAQLAALALPMLPVTPEAYVIAPAPIAPAPQFQMQTPQPPAKKAVAQDNRYVPGALPESDVLPQYRNSGEIIAR
jgi:spore germination cell wall hydrolase CwlJ-like protein